MQRDGERNGDILPLHTYLNLEKKRKISFKFSHSRSLNRFDQASLPLDSSSKRCILILEFSSERKTDTLSAV